MELNLSNNPLGDGVIGLCRALTSSFPKLRGLGLGSCILGSEAAAHALADYIGQAQRLSNLDLHWNKFTSSTGYLIVSGLYDNTSIPQPGTSLRRVHLGHNSLGSGQRGPQEKKCTKALNRCLWEAMRCAKTLAMLFAENKTLFHFDLSYNNFSPAESQAIGEGLRENNTIFGLHFVGNAGVVDPEGFIKQVPANTAAEPPTKMLDLLIPTKFKSAYTCTPACAVSEENQVGWLEKRQQVGVPESFNTHEGCHNLGCWVCDNWIAYTIIYHPKERDCIPMDAEIQALLSIDRYEVPVPLVSDVGRRRWKSIRMVPPSSGPIIVLFRYKDQFILCKEMSTMSTASLDLPPFVSSMEFVNFIRPDKLARELDIKGKSWELRYSDAPPANTKVYPRGAVDIKAKDREAWTFAKSIFKDYQRDTPSQFALALEADWSRTKLYKVVQDASRIKETLKPRYEDMVNIFRATSVQCTVPVFATTRNAFTIFCQKCDPKFFDSRFGLSDADTVFVAANFVDEETRSMCPVVSDKGLVRFQFLEAFVRLAMGKFNGLGTNTAVKKMIDIMLDDGAQMTNDRAAFQDMLFTEECHFVVADEKENLRTVFDKYCTFMSNPGSNKDMLSYHGWKEFLNDINAYDDDFTKREAAIPFAFYAKQLHVDDQKDYRAMDISFAEFLVAVGAVVRMKEGFDEELYADQLEEFLSDELRDVATKIRQGAGGKGDNEMDAETRRCCAFICKVFEEADEDNSGTLTFGEFRRGFQSDRVKNELCSLGMKIGDMRLLFKQIDKDVDSAVTIKEVLSVFLEMRKKSQGSQRVIAFLEQAFGEGDEDKSGTMSKEEFKKLFSRRVIVAKLEHLGLDVADMEEMFERVDVDGSGEIAVDELVSVFLSLRDPDKAANSALGFMKKVMRESDIDSSGTLNLPELRSLLSDPRISKKMKRFDIELPPALEFFVAMDEDQNGELSWDEISGYIEQQMIQKRKSRGSQTIQNFRRKKTVG